MILHGFELVFSWFLKPQVVVISAEQDAIRGPGCCGPEALEALADALVDAEQLVNGEEVRLRFTSSFKSFN